ncbi:hypothetical protein RFI_32430, partial [Reticulomyxa filosa]
LNKNHKKNLDMLTNQEEDIKEDRNRENAFRFDKLTLSHSQKVQTDDWNCSTCQKSNKQQYLQCIKCQTPRPNYDQPKNRQFLLSSMPWRNTEHFDCIIAIDFGTDGTAMGITMKKADSVRLITDWSSSGICDKKEVRNKTKTALLLDKNHQVIAFGNEAWAKFRHFISIYSNKFKSFYSFSQQNYFIFLKKDIKTQT